LITENKLLSTKEKIVFSAVSLFSEHWYEAVSVAEICRNSGLSNGVFYRYYKDKEVLFREILDGFLEVIKDRMGKIKGDDVETRLVSFYGFILESNINDQAYISIFREGEYRFPEYEKRLRDIYDDALKRVYNRRVSAAEYLFIVGSVRFMLRRPCFDEKKITAEYLKNLVYNGLFECPTKIDFSCLDIDFPPAVDNADEADTRTKLILSGKQLIAENSFYKVNIYEITRNAGFAVGTFYINFKSKEDLFREVVKYLGKQLRHYISSNLGGNLSRVAREIQGWMLFLKYFETHIQNYQIVREAEFVIKDTAREYYNKFEKGYLKQKGVPRSEDESVVANFLIGIAHFLGIEYFFSKNIEDPKQVVEELSTLICGGVKE
jgi:AcrR family transcriptional regulator